MSFFSYMRDYARNVEDGIELLENRLRDPQKMSLVTTYSCRIAESTIDTVFKELMSMKDDIKSHIQEEFSDVKDSKEICQEVEEFIKEVESDLIKFETDMIQFGYVPFRKEDSDQISDVINSVTIGQNLKTSNSNCFLEESPVFTSPNYNSTPDSASNAGRRIVGSCLGYDDRQFMTPKLRQRMNLDTKKKW